MSNLEDKRVVFKTFCLCTLFNDAYVQKVDILFNRVYFRFGPEYRYIFRIGFRLRFLIILVLNFHSSDNNKMSYFPEVT